MIKLIKAGIVKPGISKIEPGNKEFSRGSAEYFGSTLLNYTKLLLH